MTRQSHGQSCFWDPLTPDPIASPQSCLWEFEATTMQKVLAGQGWRLHQGLLSMSWQIRIWSSPSWARIYIYIHIYIHEDWDKSSSFLYVGRVLSPKVGAGASLVFHQFVPKWWKPFYVCVFFSLHLSDLWFTIPHGLLLSWLVTLMPEVLMLHTRKPTRHVAWRWETAFFQDTTQREESSCTWLWAHTSAHRSFWSVFLNSSWLEDCSRNRSEEMAPSSWSKNGYIKRYIYIWRENILPELN